MGCGNSTVSASQPDAEKPQKPTAESRVLRGQMYLQQGLLDQALVELDCVIETWPSTARAYLERGNVKMQRLQFDAAVIDFSAAIKFQSNYMMAFVMRAQAYLQLRRFDEALKDCAEAGRLDADNAQVKALKHTVQKARTSASSTAGSGEDSEDPFAGCDSPTDSKRGANKLCMVCMDNERGCRLRPCLHSALCVECAASLKARGYGCPICSARVEDVEVGRFMSTFSVDDAAPGMFGGLLVARGLSASNKSPLSNNGRRFVPPSPGGVMPPLAEEDAEGVPAATLLTAPSDAMPAPPLLQLRPSVAWRNTPDSSSGSSSGSLPGAPPGSLASSSGESAADAIAMLPHAGEAQQGPHVRLGVLDRGQGRSTSRLSTNSRGMDSENGAGTAGQGNAGGGQSVSHSPAPSSAAEVAAAEEGASVPEPSAAAAGPGSRPGSLCTSDAADVLLPGVPSSSSAAAPGGVVRQGSTGGGGGGDPLRRSGSGGRRSFNGAGADLPPAGSAGSGSSSADAAASTSHAVPIAEGSRTSNSRSGAHRRSGSQRSSGTGAGAAAGEYVPPALSTSAATPAGGGAPMGSASVSRSGSVGGGSGAAPRRSGSDSSRHGGSINSAGPVPLATATSSGGSAAPPAPAGGMPPRAPSLGGRVAVVAA